MQTWNHTCSLLPSSWSFIELLLCAQHCAIFHLYNSVPMYNSFPLAYYHAHFIDQLVTNSPWLVPNKNPLWGSETKEKFILWSENEETQAHIVESRLSQTGGGQGCFISISLVGEVELSLGMHSCADPPSARVQSLLAACWEEVWVHQLCTRNSVQLWCTQHESSTCVPLRINETRLSTKRINV